MSYLITVITVISLVNKSTLKLQSNKMQTKFISTNISWMLIDHANHIHMHNKFNVNFAGFVLSIKEQLYLSSQRTLFLVHVPLFLVDSIRMAVGMILVFAWGTIEQHTIEDGSSLSWYHSQTTRQTARKFNRPRKFCSLSLVLDRARECVCECECYCSFFFFIQFFVR